MIKLKGDELRVVIKEIDDELVFEDLAIAPDPQSEENGVKLIFRRLEISRLLEMRMNLN